MFADNMINNMENKIIAAEINNESTFSICKNSLIMISGEIIVAAIIDAVEALNLKLIGIINDNIKHIIKNVIEPPRLVKTACLMNNNIETE